MISRILRSAEIRPTQPGEPTGRVRLRHRWVRVCCCFWVRRSVNSDTYLLSPAVVRDWLREERGKKISVLRPWVSEVMVDDLDMQWDCCTGIRHTRVACWVAWWVACSGAAGEGGSVYFWFWQVQRSIFKPGCCHVTRVWDVNKPPLENSAVEMRCLDGMAWQVTNTLDKQEGTRQKWMRSFKSGSVGLLIRHGLPKCARMKIH